MAVVIRMQTAQTDLLHVQKIVFYKQADASGKILVS